MPPLWQPPQAQILHLASSTGPRPASRQLLFTWLLISFQQPSVGLKLSQVGLSGPRFCLPVALTGPATT